MPFCYRVLVDTIDAPEDVQRTNDGLAFEEKPPFFVYRQK